MALRFYDVGAVLRLENTGQTIQTQGHLGEEQLKSLEILRQDRLAARCPIAVGEADRPYPYA